MDTVYVVMLIINSVVSGFLVCTDNCPTATSHPGYTIVKLEYTTTEDVYDKLIQNYQVPTSTANERVLSEDSQGIIRIAVIPEGTLGITVCGSGSANSSYTATEGGEGAGAESDYRVVYSENNQVILTMVDNDEAEGKETIGIVRGTDCSATPKVTVSISDDDFSYGYLREDVVDGDAAAGSASVQCNLTRPVSHDVTLHFATSETDAAYRTSDASLTKTIAAGDTRCTLNLQGGSRTGADTDHLTETISLERISGADAIVLVTPVSEWKSVEVHYK